MSTRQIHSHVPLWVCGMCVTIRDLINSGVLFVFPSSQPLKVSFPRLADLDWQFGGRRGWLSICPEQELRVQIPTPKHLEKGTLRNSQDRISLDMDGCSAASLQKRLQGNSLIRLKIPEIWG